MKKVLFVTIILFVSMSSFASKGLVEISKSIVIDAPVDIVFNHVSNTMNDHTWRDEVNSMSADGAFEVGTIFTEDARIGLQQNFITRTQLLDLKENLSAYYETPNNDKFFLSSYRHVKSVSSNKTLFTYTVKFDQEMSKVTLGVKVPRSILKIGYGVIMKRYLVNLKEYFR
jgi:hypothetical protein